jgi:hypothetical protein
MNMRMHHRLASRAPIIQANVERLDSQADF